MNKLFSDSNILSALIGAGVTLLVLILTIFWERWKAKADLKKQRRKKLIYAAAVIHPIIKYSEKQAANMKEFVAAIQKNPLEFPLLGFAPKSEIEKFVHKIDDEAFFDAFTSFYQPYTASVKTFKEITSSISYQNLQMEQIVEMVKTSADSDHERKLKFKNSMKAAISLATNAIADKSINEHPDLLQLLDANLANFMENRKSAADIKFAHDAFALPVIAGIVQNGYYHIPVGNQIASHLHETSEVYHDIIMQMKSLADDFFQIASAYLKSNETLKKESSKLLEGFFKD